MNCRAAALLVLGAGSLPLTSGAQVDARRGVEVRGTVSAQAAACTLSTEPLRSGSPATVGYRVVLYPTLKLGEHWSVTGALQSYSRPYFRDSLNSPGYGVSDNVLNATLNYARVSPAGLLQVRVGQLPSAFGTFLLRYDDADNALVQVPLQYGYYGVVGLTGLAGAQVDAARGKWDGRVQWANSSPANPRSIFARDQYSNWAGGVGYTIRQGLHVGGSAYGGPYLSRSYPFFLPGEIAPSRLKAYAWGADADYTRGYWTVHGEVQGFHFPYTAAADFNQRAGYVEARRTLSPRWYAAGRAGFSQSDLHTESYEGALGFRPNRLQVLKTSYEWEHRNSGTSPAASTFAVQLVTSVKLFSAARQ